LEVNSLRAIEVVCDALFSFSDFFKRKKKEFIVLPTVFWHSLRIFTTLHNDGPWLSSVFFYFLMRFHFQFDIHYQFRFQIHFNFVLNVTPGP